MSALGRQIMQDAPVAYWPFQETSGSTAVDVSGNGRNATHNANVGKGVAGPAGQLAADYLSNGDTVIGDSTVWLPTPGFTAEAWVRLRNYAPANKFPFLIWQDGSWSFSASNFYSGGAAGRPTMQVARSGGGEILNFTASRNLVLSRWEHIAFVYDDSTKIGRVYLGGVLDTTSAAGTGSVVDSGNGVLLGRGYTDGHWMDGSIAHVAVYQKVVAVDRLMAHYQAGIRGGVMTG